jgi:hypothetical protein
MWAQTGALFRVQDVFIPGRYNYTTWTSDEYHVRIRCGDIIFGPMAKIDAGDRKWAQILDDSGSGRL